ncbi:MAG: hypothetical protein ACI84D_002030 [Thalassolituus oleivorans]|jgi:hypothetical protein
MHLRFLTTLFLLALVVAPATQAQEFSLGSDVYSRYIWRGHDFGESTSVQPALAFSIGGLEIGTWASYSISADGAGAGAGEHDLWASYSVETATAGSFSVGVTDYYFPAPDGLGFFEFDGDGEGAHWIEPFVSYTGPKSLPISLSAAFFAHNDPDNSAYLQASIPFSTEGTDLAFTVGAVTGESGFYGTDGFAVVNLGLSASKEIELTDKFSIPVSVSYILNPETERTFLVFGISF